MSVAVLIDGSFFLKRYRKSFGKKTPKDVANDLFTMALKHVDYVQDKGRTNISNNIIPYLYRVFYYDAAPLKERTRHPLTGEQIDFKDSEEFKFRTEFLEELKKKRKVALRMGRLSTCGWQFRKTETVKNICKGKIKHTDLDPSDVTFSRKQKGVDMKIGLDIATIAYKKLASAIILVSGDSDFVPAAKLARREGIDFILDPMYSKNIRPDLFEHIDGLKSFLPQSIELPLPKGRRFLLHRQLPRTLVFGLTSSPRASHPVVPTVGRFLFRQIQYITIFFKRQYFFSRRRAWPYILFLKGEVLRPLWIKNDADRFWYLKTAIFYHE